MPVLVRPSLSKSLTVRMGRRRSGAFWLKVHQPQQIATELHNEQQQCIDRSTQGGTKTLIVTDCETERAALLERSSRAGAEVLARRCQVDNLSTRLSSLARLHKTLVGNQGHTLAILETLRSQLGVLSNYTPPIK